jgi:hypothetical protein
MGEPADIKDFILLEWNHDLFQIRMRNNMVRQLRHYHPNASIHLLTNQRRQEEGVIVHYKPHLHRGHLSKFRVFSLLDRPAMYLDCDIILTRPFEQKHIKTNNPFFLYYWYPWPPFYHYKHYNGGMIWIQRPDVALTKKLWQIHGSLGNPSFNEEYAISRFAYNNKLKMYPNSDVNVPRNAVKQLLSPQTIHYAGRDNKRYYHRDFEFVKRKKLVKPVKQQKIRRQKRFSIKVF